MAGERFATWWLSGQGLVIEGANVRVDGGEIDIVAGDGDLRVVVEVRTVSSGEDPIDAVGEAKRARVRRLASSVRAQRVDFLGIAFRADAVVVHWVPG